MTRDEAIRKYIIPAIKRTWKDEKCNEIIEALEQQTCTREDFIQYAKEHYGIDIEFKDSDKPDTFNELFGVEVCEDAVSREAVLAAIDTWDKFGVDDTNSLFRLNNLSLPHYVPYMHYDDVIKCIKSIPSVNPQQKMGHWIEYTRVLIPEPFNSWEQAWYCSECGYGNQECEDGSVWLEWKYCPNCGCRMVEPQESEVKE